uniref:Uncharacterized protein n=1 Tax=Panagrolaimus sp. JU765 TaxID=591449 RepID=A0AC34Q9K7_9BILA
MPFITPQFLFECSQYGIAIAICVVAGSYAFFYYRRNQIPDNERVVEIIKEDDSDETDSHNLTGTVAATVSGSKDDISTGGVLRRRHSTDGPFQFASVAKAFIRNRARARYKRQFSEVVRPSLPKPPTEYFEPSDLPEIPQNLRPEYFYLRHNMQVLELPNELSLDPKYIDVLVYKKDDFIVKVGDQDDSMYVVLGGLLNMFIKHEGKEFLVRKLKKGQTFFSYLSLIDILMNKPSVFKTVSLRAVETSTVARFNLAHFRESHQDSPELWCRPIQIIMSRLLHVTMTTLHQYLGIGEEMVRKRLDERQVDEKRHSMGHSVRLVGLARPKQRRASSSDLSSELIVTATKWFSEALGLTLSEGQTLLTPHITLGFVDDKQILVEERSEEEASLILVLKGRLAITKSASLDDEDFEPWSAFIYPREIIGALQILTGEPSFFQISGSCSTTVAMISKTFLQTVICQHPAVVLPLAYTTVRRMSPFIRSIDYAMDWVMLDSGQAVYRLGDNADAMFVVLSGRLRCVDKKTAVAEFGRGDVLGMVELIQKKPRTTTVLAVRFSQLARLPDGLINFIKILFPQVGFRLVRLLGMSYNETRHAYLSPPLFSLDNAAPDSMAQLKNLHTVAIIAASPTVPIISFTCELYHALSPSMKVLRLSARQVGRCLGEDCLEKLADFRLMHWLNTQEDTYQLVIYECDYEPTHWTRRCLRQADTILVVAQGSEKAREKPFFEEHLKMNQDGIRTRKELILLWNMKTEQPKGTYEWLKGSWFSGHYHVRAPFRMFRSMTSEGQLDEVAVLDFYQKEVFGDKVDANSDFARLGRILTGNAIGLVLGGGGARGASHVGIIQALQHYGIPIDIVGGTSIGSMIGGLFAEDPYKTSKFHARAKIWFETMSSLWRKLWDLTYAHSAMFTGAGFNRTLQDLFSDISIEDLWLPYFCITTDITSSEMRVHRSGPLWMYCRASMSLAGYLPPLCDPADTHLLLDGGYVNNLPADVIRSIGARVVIAVDVGSATENNLYNYGDHLSGFWVLWKRFWPWTEPVRILGMEEIQSRLAFVSCVRQLELVKKAPYCHYLRPPIEGFKTLDFAKYDMIRAIGLQYGTTAAEEMIEKNTEIRTLLLIDSARPLTRRQRRQQLARSRNNSFTDLAAEASRIPSKKKETKKPFDEEEEWDEEGSDAEEDVLNADDVGYVMPPQQHIEEKKSPQQPDDSDDDGLDSFKMPDSPTEPVQLTPRVSPNSSPPNAR